MVILCCFGLIPPALAQSGLDGNRLTPDTVRSSEYPELKRTGPARVDRVIDGLTVTLKDKRIVRLSGIDIPGYGEEQADAPLAAFNALQKLLPESANISLYQTRSAKSGRENRMGQMLAHLEVDKSKLWVQGALLAQGLARVMPVEPNLEMVPEMLAIENRARSYGRGIWSKDSGWHLLFPEETRDKIGTVQVVQGTIDGAASVKNNLYLNFGKDWKTDFTVRIAAPLRKKLAKDGIDPMALSGKNVRVRGYIDEYNGPMITLDNIQQLEILKDPA